MNVCICFFNQRIDENLLGLTKMNYSFDVTMFNLIV